MGASVVPRVDENGIVLLKLDVGGTDELEIEVIDTIVLRVGESETVVLGISDSVVLGISDSVVLRAVLIVEIGPAVLGSEVD